MTKCAAHFFHQNCVVLMRRWLAKYCLLMLCLVVAAESATAKALPDFAELESSGAIIGKIMINPQNIFDLNNQEENQAFFQWANRLHVLTRPEVISRLLLFKAGERVSKQKIDEAERLLRNSSTHYDVNIRPVAYTNGIVDIEVVTRDAWTLELTGSFSRAGGDNKTSFGVVEQNLLGSGVGIGYSRTADIDRNGSEFELSIAQAFDGWTKVDFFRGRYNDGKRTALAIDRPFYAFDTRQAVHLAWRDEERMDSIFNAGNTISEFRRRIRFAEISGGWSPGMVNSWVKRFTAGATIQDQQFGVAVGRSAPLTLPVDNNLRALFVRVDLLEDRFVKVKNFNRIERPEYLALGFNGRLQLSLPVTVAGSTHSQPLFAATVSNGFRFSGEQILQVSGSFARRIGEAGLPMTQVGARIKFYSPRAARSLVYASATWDHVQGGGITDQLLIGGNFGLRGYPSRYQAGEQRVLFSIEKRVFAKWYPLRLLRIGGAVFFDTGRAWGGQNQNTINGGQLSDIGIGLRIALDRTAFANMLHVDLAMPLNRAPGIKPVQFLIKSEFSF